MISGWLGYLKYSSIERNTMRDEMIPLLFHVYSCGSYSVIVLSYNISAWNINNAVGDIGEQCILLTGDTVCNIVALSAMCDDIISLWKSINPLFYFQWLIGWWPAEEVVFWNGDIHHLLFNEAGVCSDIHSAYFGLRRILHSADDWSWWYIHHLYHWYSTETV